MTKEGIIEEIRTITRDILEQARILSRQARDGVTAADAANHEETAASYEVFFTKRFPAFGEWVLAHPEAHRDVQNAVLGLQQAGQQYRAARNAFMAAHDPERLAEEEERGSV